VSKQYLAETPYEFFALCTLLFYNSWVFKDSALGHKSFVAQMRRVCISVCLYYGAPDSIGFWGNVLRGRLVGYFKSLEGVHMEVWFSANRIS